MQESKDMREKNIEPEIYREVKVTNNGWCVLDHALQSAYRCHVTEQTHFPPAESRINENFVEKMSRVGPRGANQLTELSKPSNTRFTEFTEFAR